MGLNDTQYNIMNTVIQIHPQDLASHSANFWEQVAHGSSFLSGNCPPPKEANLPNYSAMPDIASISGKYKNVNFWPSSLIRNDSERSSQARSILWDCHRPLLIVQFLPLPNPASITLTGVVLRVPPHPPPLINLLHVNLLLRRFLGDLT